MKKIFKTIATTMFSLLLLSQQSFAETYYDFGNPKRAGEAIKAFLPEVQSVSTIIMSIALYASIIVVGINIIVYRNKADERSSAMTGLMYLAIGVIIFTCAYFFCGILAPELLEL